MISRIVILNDASVARGGATGLALLSIRLLRARGFEVTLRQEPDLPAHVDADVLRSEHYLHFSVLACCLLIRLTDQVACTSVFALANRLDVRTRAPLS